MSDHAYDDATRLRIAQAEADADATRPGPVATRGAPCVVAKVVSGSGAAPRFFTMQAYDVSGAEVDGGAGTLTDAGYSFKAMNVGGSAPAAGTAVICTRVPYRWVFKYG